MSILPFRSILFVKSILGAIIDFWLAEFVNRTSISLVCEHLHSVVDG